MNNPWCQHDLAFNSYDELMTIIESRYTSRDELLTNIMSVGPHNIRDLEFPRDFYQLLLVNDKCLCRDFIEERTSRPMPFTILRGDAKSGKVGTTHQIDVLGHPGMKLIIKSIKNVQYRGYLSILVEPLLKSKLTSHALINQYYNQNPFISTEGTPILISIRSDNFSNQTIIHMLMETILSPYHNRGYVYQYDAFICGAPSALSYENTLGNYVGYNIMEYANHGDLSNYFEKLLTPLTTEIVDDILGQLFTTLNILTQPEYSFVHSDLKAKNVFVMEEPDGNIIYKIADYDKASITWRGVRFYNRGPIGAEVAKTTSETLATTTQGLFGLFGQPLRETKSEIFGYLPNPSTKDGIAYYKIPTLANTALAIRHNAIPFYKSYDVYTFLFSLMMEPPFYRWYRDTHDSKFHRIWERLWEPNQYQIIRDIIGKLYVDYIQTPMTLRKDFLTRMRSIAEINNLLHQNSILLRVDIQFVYDILEIPMPEYIDIQHLPDNFYETPILISSSEIKPCLTPCETYDYISTEEKKGYKSPTNFIDYQETTSKTKYSNSIYACQSYPYSKGTKTYTWDYCEKK